MIPSNELILLKAQVCGTLLPGSVLSLPKVLQYDLAPSSDDL